MSKYQGVDLYVKYLEDDMDDEKLPVFEPYGTITLLHCHAALVSLLFSPEEATKSRQVSILL